MGRLSRIVSRFWIVFLAGWVALAVAVKTFVPDLDTIARPSEHYVPPYAASYRAKELLGRSFPSFSFESSLVLAFERDGGLTQEDRTAILEAADAVRDLAASEFPNITNVLTRKTDPTAEDIFCSSDGAAEFFMVGLDTPFPAPISRQAVAAIEDAVAARAAAGLDWSVTGDAALGRDYIMAAAESLDRTTLVTAVFLLVSLVVIYRSPVAPIVPLATIGIAYTVASGVVGLLGQAGMPVSSMVKLILLVVLFGSGTDYCLFLIARYGEELTKQNDRVAAVGTGLRAVGSAVAASAITTMLGLACMGFAHFQVYATTGPWISLGLAVGLACALTFTPALLRLLGRAVFWPFGPEQYSALGRPFWEGLARGVVRRPVVLAVLVVVAAMPFVAFGLKATPTYDLFAQLPPSSPSVKGYEIMKRHFRAGDASPVELVAAVDGDLWRPENLDAVHHLGRLIQSDPGVIDVRSATQPAGDPLRKGGQYLQRWQAGLLSNQLAAYLSVMEPVMAYLKGAGASIRAATMRAGLEKVSRHLAAVIAVSRKSAAFERFFLPPDELEADGDARAAIGRYISADGSSMRMQVVLKDPAFSAAARATLARLKELVAGWFRTCPFQAKRVLFGGTTATIADVEAISGKDFMRVGILVLAGVFCVLVVLFRRIGTPLYLLATIVLTYLATVGVTAVVFGYAFGGRGLDYKLSFFAFVLLVAIGIDYNIYLMTRLREEAASASPATAARRAVVTTGRAISLCGIIMAGTFGSMMSGTLFFIVQVGFAVAVGILVDTFLVRPLLVPALYLVFSRLKVRVSYGVGCDEPDDREGEP